MIEYQYKLVRNEGDEIRTFTPDQIPSKLENLVYIEGPNSCGKSTLLNILALSFHGLKNKEIPKSLKSKMMSLLDTEYQELTFNVKITNKDNSLTLISEMTDPKKPVKLYEILNGQKKLLTDDTFHRYYNVIYDIPIDPTARLIQLTTDIKDNQIRYGNCVGELRARIKEIIEEIRHSKDPNRITELTRLIEQNEDDEITHKKAKQLLEEEIDALEKYTFKRFYDDFKSAYEQKKQEAGKLEKSRKKEERDKKRLSDKAMTKMLTAHHGLREMQEIYNEVTPYLRTLIPKQEKHHLNIWERIDFNESLKTFEFDENFTEEIIHFQSVLTNLINEKYKQEQLKEGEFYKYLLEFLGNFSDLEIVLPGGITINEFKNEIEKLQRNFEPTLKTSENIENAIQLLKDLKLKKETIELNILQDLKALKEISPEISDEEYQQQYTEDTTSEIKKLVEYLERKTKFYEDEWIKKGRPSWEQIQNVRSLWQKYSTYTEQQLKERISQLKEQLLETKAKLHNLETQKQRITFQKTELEKKKDHPYRKYLDKLDDQLRPIVESLQQQLQRDFDAHIRDIIDEKAKHSSDKKKECYYKAIFTYLAKKIGYIRYLNDEFKVKNIDLVDKIIFTEDNGGKNKKIRFADMGTGQGQSAYLVGKLNTADDRKIIALFDEVAMMDSHSLAPIYKRFKELYKEDHLLAGIVVQKADSVNVISKM